MSEDHSKPKNTDSPRDWQKLVWEFFDCIFRNLIPGSIAVYLYAPHFADKVMGATSFVGPFVFLGLAWVAGVTLEVFTFNVVYIPVELLCKISALRVKLLGKWLHSKFFPGFSWAIDQTENNAAHEPDVYSRMWLAQKVMFRSIAALALSYAAFSFTVRHCAWLSNHIASIKLLTLGILSLICFCFMHKIHLDRCSKERKS
jgi:hypothetical protein